MNNKRFETFAYGNSVVMNTPEGSIPIIVIDFEPDENGVNVLEAFKKAERINNIFQEDSGEKWLYLGILNYN